jgi:hypothetical protein
MAAQPKGFALMTEDLQPRIAMDLTMNGSRFMIGWGAKPASMIGWGEKPASMIGWGVGPAFMIGWDAESMKSQTIGWKRWPILWSLMRTSCGELLNVDAHYD